jgi:hypothetical protein
MAARQELDSFIAKYSPEVAGLAGKAFAWMRRKFPAATVAVYDNYNALAIGFGTSERVPDAVFSIVLYPRWVNLFFLKGATLPDPDKLLQGAGNRVRSIRLENLAQLDDPKLLALLDAEAARSGLIPGVGSGKIVIKSTSAKQRARKPAQKPVSARSTRSSKS